MAAVTSVTAKPPSLRGSKSRGRAAVAVPRHDGEKSVIASPKGAWESILLYLEDQVHF